VNDQYVWALKDVSFEINHGDAVGIVGHNGAGKSVLLKILSRVTSPSEGYAELHGKVGSMLEVGTGFHPELTGRENIYLGGTILSMKKDEINRKFDEIVDFSGVERFLDTPVKHYSSGMSVRLAFAIAAHLEPEIMMLDEVLAVGDDAFKQKCLNKMKEVVSEGRTALLVSHDMRTVEELCDRAVFLRNGRVVAFGDTQEIVSQYLARNPG
jgi:lipopolysaccharide transport system ATP-binding protein